ncbi:hypothetical protein RSOL_288230, partial [Rhizoctonia solani AG-3 Rhs1AP]
MFSYDKLTAEQIKKFPDAVVWSWLDEIILAASQAEWRASIYGHYDPSVDRRTDELGQKVIWYPFTCKSDPRQRKALYRSRGDDSSGTNKLIDAAAISKVSITKTSRQFNSVFGESIIFIWL